MMFHFVLVDYAMLTLNHGLIVRKKKKQKRAKKKSLQRSFKPILIYLI